jgi:D-glycerate 3-kinase
MHAEYRALIEDIIRQRQLPDSFALAAEEHFLPLANRIEQARKDSFVRLVGINGAQGSGKSTLSCFLQRALKLSGGLNVAVLSIDDVYLTQSERRILAEQIHPLFRTRGVPGTHDIGLLSSTLDRLSSLGKDESMRLPRFGKGSDDRLPQEDWEEITGPVDLTILEGWCVGTPPQPVDELEVPVNPLERLQDESLQWRQCVNQCLEGPYAEVFAKIDYLVFLQVPDFDSIFRWRLEQEQKLQAAEGNGSAIMDESELREFMHYFERLTRYNLVAVPKLADAILRFNRDHCCYASYYR